ncbi:hypothetical protein LPJ75_000471 [Coemansia sp. RSA 2598]|nr:hypothetical protein LPJ75_000471 [Coemansia sp. RSA 2598]
MQRIVVYEQAADGQWRSNLDLLPGVSGGRGMQAVVRSIYVTSACSASESPAFTGSQPCHPSAMRISVADALFGGLIEPCRVHYMLAPRKDANQPFVATGALLLQRCCFYRRLLADPLLGGSVVDLDLCHFDGGDDAERLVLGRCAPQLVRLRLADMPAARVWDMLRLAAGDLGVFPMLQTLELRFLDDHLPGLPAAGNAAADYMLGRADGSHHQAFAALRSLCVANFPLDIRHCLEAFPLRRLRDLRLDMAWHVARGLSSSLHYLQALASELRSLDGHLHISCTGAMQAVGASRVSSLVRSVLAGCRNTRALCLELNLQRPLASIELSADAAFRRLSVLELHFAVNLSAVSALLGKMPVLRKLSVQHVSTAYESLACVACRLLPASVSLEVLELGLFDYQVTTAVVCGALLAFVESLVALRLLVVDKRLAMEMRRLVGGLCRRVLGASKPHASHLKRIRITDKSGK